MFSNSYDPFKMVASGIALWADAARTMQAQYIESVTHLVDRGPGTLEWKTLEVPVFTTNTELSDQRLQQAFQTAANINVSAWTHTANMLAAMPDWSRLTTQVPGRAMTDMFDKMRPRKGL